MSLKEEFKDKEYRQAYADSFANSVIATQIRLLRGKMTQKQFAELVGIKQSRVSAMEDENYSMWSTKTLKNLAAKNDVVFLGRFVSFGELLHWSRTFSESNLLPRAFNEDPVFATSTDASSLARTLGTFSIGTATSTSEGTSPVTKSLARPTQTATRQLKLLSKEAA